MPARTSFTYPLSPAEQQSLAALLREGNYRPLNVPHSAVAAEAEHCRVVLYRSGKCVVQGRGAEDFETFFLEPLVLRRAELGYEEVLDPEAARPHLGVDESGKGDFFGPLVVAAAYVDPDLAQRMRELEVKDSKRITSDDKALGMGEALRKLLGPRYAVVRIGPAAYNRLYMRMRNVNRMLAWAHARAIEDLLAAVPDCPRAISDQFGSKRQVEQALMKRGRRIELIQKPRAESDLAVAAASVIAREGFLRSLKELEREFGCRLPKGASAAVREAGTALVERHQPAALVRAAKCHFKTADSVLAATGSSRAALGPEGQAVSQARTWQRRPKR